MTVGLPLYVTSAEVETVLSACRVLMAVSSRAAGTANRLSDPAQLPILLALAGTAGLPMKELAAAVQSPSMKVARLCERLVEAGLVDLVDDPANLTATRLTLTGAGQELLTTTLDRRREALEMIVGRLPAARGAEFLAILRGFGIERCGTRPTPDISSTRREAWTAPSTGIAAELR